MSQIPAPNGRPVMTDEPETVVPPAGSSNNLILIKTYD